MNKRQEFNALAERILHSIILSPRPTGNAVKEAVETAEEFLDALRRRHEDLRNVDGLTAEEVDLLREGQVISCIKSVRERSGWNLKEAKAHVDKMRAQLGL